MDRCAPTRTLLLPGPIVTGVSMWGHRQALRLLVSRELQQKYRNYRLGYLWAILEPLGMSVTMWFVFQVLLGGRRLGEHPYFLFLTVAILPWWWFTNSISASTKVFQGNTRPLVASLLPTEFMVARVLFTRMGDFLLSLPLVVVAMLITWTFPGPLIVLFPVAMLIQLILMYGLSLFVASISAVVPDFARVVRIVLRAAFYLTPVLYAVSNIPKAARAIAPFNPLVGILSLYRLGWWGNEHEGWKAYGISFAIVAATVVLGIVVFKRLEGRILKEA